VSSGVSRHRSNWPARGIFKNKSNTTASWTERCGGAVRCWRRSGAISKFNARRVKASGRTRRWQKKDQSNAGKRKSISSGVSRNRPNWLARATQRLARTDQRLRGFPGIGPRMAGKSDSTLERACQHSRECPGIGPRMAGKSDSTLERNNSTSSGNSRRRSDLAGKEMVQRWKEQFNIVGNFPASVRFGRREVVQRWKEQLNIVGNIPASVRFDR